jgi:hypothetical protein
MATMEAALATHVAVIEGSRVFKDKSDQHPNSKIEVNEAPSSSVVKTIHFGVTNKKVFDHLSHNQHQVIEVFQARLLQQWQDFLGDIYFRMVMDILKKEKAWPISTITGVSLETDDLQGEPMDHAIANACWRSFSFKPYRQKQEIVLNALASAKELKNRLGKVKSQLKTINENISIRNILQHNHGKVVSKDLADLGIQCFEVIISDNEKVKIKKNETVYRTYKDLENLSDAISDVTRVIKEVGVIANLGM